MDATHLLTYLEGRVAVLHGDASIRRVGAELAAFKGDENLTFPAQPDEAEIALYTTLAEQGRIANIDPKLAACVARLVLDGVLTLEHDGARRLSGLAFANAVFAAADCSSPPDRHTLLLAGRLLHAARPDALAHSLYTSGRWPAGPASLPAARRALYTLRQLTVPSAWTRIPLDSAAPWIAWKRHAAFARNPTGLPRTKLYVSVDPAVFEARGAELFDVIFASGETHEVKTASSPAGLHRGDAVVVYSEAHRHLAALAREISRVLGAGVPPSGMTFAAAFPGLPNVFWGIDPLLPEHLVYGESWRKYLCNRCARLASGLRGNHGGFQPLAVARAALWRLALDGIDTLRWIPPYASQTA